MLSSGQLQSVVGQSMPPLAPRRHKIPAAILDTVSNGDFLTIQHWSSVSHVNLSLLELGRDALTYPKKACGFSLPPLQNAKLHHEMCTVL